MNNKNIKDCGNYFGRTSSDLSSGHSSNQNAKPIGRNWFNPNGDIEGLDYIFTKPYTRNGYHYVSQLSSYFDPYQVTDPSVVFVKSPITTYTRPYEYFQGNNDHESHGIRKRSYVEDPESNKRISVLPEFKRVRYIYHESYVSRFISTLNFVDTSVFQERGSENNAQKIRVYDLPSRQRIKTFFTEYKHDPLLVPDWFTLELANPCTSMVIPQDPKFLRKPSPKLDVYADPE